MSWIASATVHTAWSVYEDSSAYLGSVSLEKAFYWKIITVMSENMAWLGLGCVRSSLTPGKCGIYNKSVILKIMLRLYLLSTGCKIMVRRTPHNPNAHNPILVKVMDLYRLATNHYIGQRWPQSMYLCGVTRLQWVKVWSCVASEFQSQNHRNIVPSLNHAPSYVVICFVLFLVIIPVVMDSYGMFNFYQWRWGNYITVRVSVLLSLIMYFQFGSIIPLQNTAKNIWKNIFG